MSGAFFRLGPSHSGEGGVKWGEWVGYVLFHLDVGRDWPWTEIARPGSSGKIGSPFLPAPAPAAAQAQRNFRRDEFARQIGHLAICTLKK
jgi:hypothetical protein